VRRLVFLDFDGIIMTTTSYQRSNASGFALSTAAARMDRILVGRVSTLCERAEADIVLSTSWRGSTEEDRALLEEALWSRGLSRLVPVVGQTPHLEARQPTPTSWVPCDRGEEIEAWLDRHRPGWTRDRIVILDDDSDMEPLMDRWVEGCRFDRGGFLRQHLDAALRLFGIEP
jgi:hypothetical protein